MTTLALDIGYFVIGFTALLCLIAVGQQIDKLLGKWL